ncbi:MAG TPA: hypothetical protein VM616_08630 [Gammaproteobacteria bacterium]|nr:hypothetical protein [Gammaproteobacteria bacterium]
MFRSSLRASPGLRATLLSLALATAPAAAQTDTLRESLAACAGLSDDALRLGCYDALAELAADETPRGTDAPAAGSARNYPVEGEPVPAVPPPAEPPPAPAVAERGNMDLFGLENRATEDIDEIKSRFAGRFEGWSGHTLFPLENGQVWRQTESDKLSWSADNPMITISKGVFGSFRLGVEGVNKTVRVERVK